MRSTPDTDVLVAALPSHGARPAPVLPRREHLAAIRAGLSEMTLLLDTLGAVCAPVEVSFLWRPILRDPDDEMVLEVAVNGGPTGF